METGNEKAVDVKGGALRAACDLLLFAGASLGAGLLTALAAGALVIVLAQPADAEGADPGAIAADSVRPTAVER